MSCNNTKLSALCSFMTDRAFPAYQQAMEQFNWILFLALIISLPYNRYIIQPLWVAWFSTWVLEFRWLQPQTYRQLFAGQIKSDIFKRLIPVFGIAFFVLWEAVSALWAADADLVWSYVGRHASFLILPLVLLIGFNQHYDWQRVMRAFVYGAVASVLIYAFTRFWVNNYSFAFGWNTEIHPFQPFEMNDITVRMKHRLFYCMVLTMALPFLAYQWRYFLKKLGTANGILMLAVCAFLLLWGIWATSSRQSLLTIAVLAFMTVAFAVFRWTENIQRKSNRIIVRLSAVIVAVAIAVTFIVVCVKHHPRFAQLQKSYFTEYEQHINDEAFEPRIAIWNVIIDGRNDYPIYGLGAGNSTAYLTQQYQARGWDGYAFHEYHPHNQYLMIWMDLGIVAAVLFILLWLCMPWCYRHKTRYLASYFVVLMICNMVTDRMLGVIESIIVICVLFMIQDMFDKNQRAVEP